MKHLTIVGGGVAGMSAAMNALDMGMRVRLIEKRGLLGGRAYSFADKATGDTIDNGSHLMAKAYKALMKMIKSSGAEDSIIVPEALKVNYYDKNSIYKLDSSAMPGKLGLAAGLLKFNGINIAEKIKLAKYITIDLEADFNDKYPFRELTVKDYLEQRGQSGKLFRNFWEPIIIATLNARADEVSALLFIEVAKRLFAEKSGDEILISPKHSYSDIWTKIEEHLVAKGCEIIKNDSITEIQYKENFIDAIISKTGNKYKSDAYIFAGSPLAYSGIKGSERFIPTQFIEKLEFSTIISVYFWMDKPLIEEAFAGMLGTESHWLFNHGIGNRSGKFIHSVTLSAANHLESLPHTQIEKLVAKELKERLHLSDISPAHSLVIADRRATLKFTPTLENIRPAQSTSIKNCCIAGDWTATRLPATLESAALSGEKAVSKLLFE